MGVASTINTQAACYSQLPMELELGGLAPLNRRQGMERFSMTAPGVIFNTRRGVFGWICFRVATLSKSAPSQYTKLAAGQSPCDFLRRGRHGIKRTCVRQIKTPAAMSEGAALKAYALGPNHYPVHKIRDNISAKSLVPRTPCL